MVKEYVLNICYYVIITTIIFNLFPNEKYIKYIKLISGFVLIMIIITPIAKIFDKGAEFSEIARNYAVDMGQMELEEDINEYESIIYERIKEIETSQ